MLIGWHEERLLVWYPATVYAFSVETLGQVGLATVILSEINFRVREAKVNRYRPSPRRLLLPLTNCNSATFSDAEPLCMLVGKRLGLICRRSCNIIGAAISIRTTSQPRPDLFRLTGLWVTIEEVSTLIDATCLCCLPIDRNQVRP